MRTLLMLTLLSAWPCLAQEMPGPQQSPTEPQQQVPPAQQETAPPDTAITVPEGTRLQLALANPIRTHDAHMGDTVRAVTTFPVTVDQDLAIPQGAYVVGSVVRVGKRGSNRFDGLQIEFKQLVFSNGYNVALDGSVLNAMTIPLARDPSQPSATPALMANSFQQPPPPQPPPLPQVGPSKGAVIGGTLGAFAVTVLTLAILGRRHAQARDFDTGFQFEIVLQAPLTLDKARVAAAISGSSGN